MITGFLKCERKSVGRNEWCLDARIERGLKDRYFFVLLCFVLLEGESINFVGINVSELCMLCYAYFVFLDCLCGHFATSKYSCQPV